MAQNIARTHPKMFSKIVQKLETRFVEDVYYEMNGHPIKVIEGIEALYD
jgi:hypothetical protein